MAKATSFSLADLHSLPGSRWQGYTRATNPAGYCQSYRQAVGPAVGP